MSPSLPWRITELTRDSKMSLSPQKARASGVSALTADDDFDYDTGNSISEEESEEEEEAVVEEEAAATTAALSPPRRRRSTLNSLGSAMPFEDSPEVGQAGRWARQWDDVCRVNVPHESCGLSIASRVMYDLGAALCV